VLVDPLVLKAFAGEVDEVSNSIASADVGTKMAASADGLAGSTTQWAARAVGGHFESIATKLADDVTKMGRAVRGAGDTFQVVDDDLAGNFDGLF
jgi:uncharacterized protein YukE